MSKPGNTHVNSGINEQGKENLLEKDLIENDMKDIALKIMAKHLEGRTLIKEKIKIWSDYIMEDVYNSLSKKYPQFGYGIFIFISSQTAYNSNARCVYFPKSDLHLVASFKNNNLYSSLRLCASIKKGKMKNFEDNRNDCEMIMKINNNIANSLENRKYEYEHIDEVIDNIIQDINKILLERKNIPCSYVTGYINKLPTNIINFNYNWFDFEFIPIIFVYSNASLICRVFLFLFSND